MTLDKQYQNLLSLILENGSKKGDRTGTGTISLFGQQIKHNMSEGFPLLTTKKLSLKTIVTELKWFLKGDTNIKYLQDNNCKIWDGDYNKSKRKDGELGPIYGKQWRDWGGIKSTRISQNKNVDGFLGFEEDHTLGVDQIQNLISDIKSNPNSRRLMVSAWNVGELKYMTLPPCHYGFQCYINDNKLSLMWNQRSVDTFLGLPFNIASYGLLLLLLCEETGLEAGELIGNLGDTHLYSNHIEQAKEQISRHEFTLPTIKLENVNILEGEFDYELINYQAHPNIKAPLSN